MKKLVTTITLLLCFIFIAEPAFAYSVKQGDTMTQIARENNLSLQELAEMNPQIKDLDLIYIGDTVNTEKPNLSDSLEKMDTYRDNEINLLAKLVSDEDGNEVVVEENPQTQNVTTNSAVRKKTSPSKIESFTAAEIDLLARLVRAEAQIEPFSGKVAVACVVLNRVESSAFPNTIKEVIYESGQFQPVSNGEINKPADSESIEAVKAALSDQRHLAHDSLFFYNPTIATSRWLDSRTTTVAIGHHVFKK